MKKNKVWILFYRSTFIGLSKQSCLDLCRNARLPQRSKSPHFSRRRCRYVLWKIDPAIEGNDEKIQAYKTEKFIETVRMLQPGVTQIILHATNSTPHFERISPSASLRKGDMLAMMDPKFQQFLENEGIILTTWRELMERRKQVK